MVGGVHFFFYFLLHIYFNFFQKMCSQLVSTFVSLFNPVSVSSVFNIHYCTGGSGDRGVGGTFIRLTSPPVVS